MSVLLSNCKNDRTQIFLTKIQGTVSKFLKERVAFIILKEEGMYIELWDSCRICAPADIY